AFARIRSMQSIHAADCSRGERTSTSRLVGLLPRPALSGNASGQLATRSPTLLIGGGRAQRSTRAGPDAVILRGGPRGFTRRQSKADDEGVTQNLRQRRAHAWRK